MEEEKNYSHNIHNLLIVVSAFLFFALLKITKTVSMPLVVSILLSLVVLPFIRKIHKKFKIPWIVGIIITLIFFIVLFAVIIRLLQSSVLAIVDAYPRYEKRFLVVYKELATMFDLNYNEGKTLAENLLEQLQVKQFIENFVFSFSTSMINFIKGFFVVFVLYIFLLIEVDEFQVKISLAFKGSMRHRVKSIIVRIIVDTTRFLSIKFIVSLTTGVLVYFGSLIIGLDFAIIWGFFAFVLNFIPTFGSAISIAVTILFSIVQFFPNWPPILATSILVSVVNFILGTVLEPRIQGGNLGLSPFFILVSLSIWGWIWGFIGMLLAVPFMVIIKIICANIPPLRTASILLSDKKSAESINKETSKNCNF